jgi:two-component system CheB/CheR fusion protein
MSNVTWHNKKKVIHQENRITALKKLLVYYKEITETVIEPLVILDKNMYVVTANQAFYRKFKVRKKDTVGRRICELGNNQWDTMELRKLLEGIIPTHSVFSNYQITHDFPVLGRKTMLLNARQVKSKQLVLLAMEDITVQRKHKIDSDMITTNIIANLVEQRDQLKGLNDAKDEFIALASHQLRTPATAVKQYVGMLTQGYVGKLSVDQMSMLNLAYENNERQLEIIEDLLRVAKVDAGKVDLEKSSCDVVRQIEVVIREQAILFKNRGQSVVLHKPRKQVMAHIDSKLMLMVLENLLDNAGKYSPAGEQVTIDVEQNDMNTIVSIKDHGVGISESDREKLFKKFSRIDNPLSGSVKGTGLGLYWVKKVIDLHQGIIEVISKLNEGSTFIVKVPLVVTN